MRGWLRFERRRLGVLIAAILPHATLGPEDGDPEFWAELEDSAPLILRAGLRVAAWTLGSWLSLWPREERAQRLAPLAGSRSYLVRQLVLSAKLVACFAYFRRPTHEHPGARSLEAG